jgi:hypothetical protein
VILKSVSNRFRLSAFAVIAALGFTAMPAQAQMPTIQHCYVPASGGNVIHSCGGISIQLSAYGIPRCGGPEPWKCGFDTYFQVRAKRNVLNYGRIISVQSQGFLTGKCFQAPTTTAWTPWCTLGPTAPVPTIWMMSVTGP